MAMEAVSKKASSVATVLALVSHSTKALVMVQFSMVPMPKAGTLLSTIIAFNSSFEGKEILFWPIPKVKVESVREIKIRFIVFGFFG